MEEFPEPANLRLLRRLVTVLTVVMISGFLVLIGLLVTRLMSNGPELPANVTLPDGQTATAFTRGDTWFAIVTTSDEILIYDSLTGQLRQTLIITSP